MTRGKRPKKKTTASPGGATLQPRVAVKLKDGIVIPYADGAEATIRRDGLGPWDALAAQFVGISIVRMYDSLRPAAITKLVARAVRTDPNYRPPNFLHCFFVDGPPSTNFAKLAAALKTWPIVERAYVVRPASAPSSPEPNPQRPAQGYLHPAVQGGIDADHSLQMPTARGAGVGFIDMETDWELTAAGTALDHEDLESIALTAAVPLVGVRDGVFIGRQHGTNVLGVVAARDNSAGLIGIAPDVTNVGLTSYRRLTSSFTLVDAIPATIMDAASRLAYGDVLLLEVQIPHPVAPFLQVPVESLRDNYEAIRLATALGIVVVEAGGNGDERGQGSVLAVDLNAFVDTTAVPNELAFDRTVRDSLAILVSAATAPADTSAASVAAALQRLPNAPFGARVDCYAWGNAIKTCGAPRDASGPYPTQFGQTSGASAIVAGAALAVQSRAQTRYGFRLGPAQMRQILRSNGTEPNPPRDSTRPETLIGLMPDLARILDAVILQGFPDIPLVYMRDFVGDPGLPNDRTDLWRSPDVIVRSAAVVNPAFEFGEGSAGQDSATLGSNVVPGRTNFVYVRVRNRGGAAAANVVIDVYWSRPSTLMTPSVWKPHKVGTTTIAAVAPGNALTVAPRIDWPADKLPPSGHNCFVAVLGLGAAPVPPDSFATMDTFVRFVQRNPDVAWRNFWVDFMAPPIFGLRTMLFPFIAPGPMDHDVAMTLQFETTLPQGTTFMVAAPIALAVPFFNHVSYVEDPAHGVILLTLDVGHVTTLPDWLFAAGSVQELSLRVTIPPALRIGTYEITVRQLWQTKVVGGFTWRLAAAPTMPPSVADVARKKQQKKVSAAGRRPPKRPRR